MGLVNMNLLNYLWETGIKPIKNAIAEKLDSSKAANNLLTTEEGFYLDARQGPEIMSMIEEQNSNLSELDGRLTAIPKNFAIRAIQASNANNADKSIFTAQVPPYLSGKINSVISSVTGGWGSVYTINTWTSGNNIMVKTSLGSNDIYTISFIMIFLIKL